MKITVPVAIVLDSSPYSLLTHQPRSPAGNACRAWERGLRAAGCLFFVPEITDYETRREMLRVRNLDALARLDVYIGAVPGRYLPLTTPAVRLACQLWAELRQAGRPTASPEALDADVLISALARMIVPADYGLFGVVIATANVGHMASITGAGPLPRVSAVLWSDILP